MRWQRFGKHADNSEKQAEPRPTKQPLTRILALFRLLSFESEPLFAQAKLHGQLAKVEWAEEKQYLLRLLLSSLLGFACFLCMLIFSGILVIALTWNTDYRIFAIVALCLAYMVATVLVCRHIIKISDRPEGAFPATRAELTSDLALLRSKLR